MKYVKKVDKTDIAIKILERPIRYTMIGYRENI